MKKLVLTTLLTGITITSLAATQSRNVQGDWQQQYGLHYNVGTQVSYGAYNADSAIELYTGMSALNIFSVGTSVEQLTDSKNAKHYQRTKFSGVVQLPTKIGPYAMESIYRCYNDDKGDKWYHETDVGVSWELTKTYSVHIEWDSVLQEEFKQGFEVGMGYNIGHFTIKPAVDIGRQNHSVSTNLAVQYNF